MFVHSPVMIGKVLSSLHIQRNDIVVDCTLGEGGHSAAFLKNLEGGCVLGIEQDEEILRKAVERLKEYEGRFIPVRGNFVSVKQIIEEKIGSKADKIFFDLGISMFHIKESGRGFSFSRAEPLDMRLDQNKPLMGRDVVNSFDKKRLSEIIWAYGEEKFSNRIAEHIVHERNKNQITTSSQLSDIIKKAIPRKQWPKHIHPATKTFQAIRIFINDEIEILENALKDAIDCLKPEGRICVISFHSLEDRIVKTVFKDLMRGCTCPPDFPVCVCGGKKVIRVLTKKPVFPDEREIRTNPASRSARLRCAYKLPDPEEENNFQRAKVSA